MSCKLDELETRAKRVLPGQIPGFQDREKFHTAADAQTILKLIAVAHAANMPSIREHWETANHLSNDEAYQLELELENLNIALDRLLGGTNNGSDDK